MDANTKTSDGYFIIAPAEWNQLFKRSIIFSPPLTTNQYTNCFSFSYFAYSKDTVGALQLFMTDLTTGKVFVDELYNTTTTKEWQRVHVPLTKRPYRFSIRFSTGFLTVNKFDIALDYFVLDDSCEHGDATTATVPVAEEKWDCSFEYLCKGWIWDDTWNVTSYHNSMYTFI